MTDALKTIKLCKQIQMHHSKDNTEAKKGIPFNLEVTSQEERQIPH